MSRRVQAGAVLAVIVAALVVSTFTTSTAQMAGAPGKTLTWVLEGNYRVNYECLFADKATTSERVEQVKRVEFHPEYIVIMDQNGAGRVVPVHALKQLKWEPS
jgi:hypothetical protein